MKIIFTCGGSAGHVNPALAVAQQFEARHPGCEILFVGAERGMEQRLVSQAGYPIETVKVSTFQLQAQRGQRLQAPRGAAGGGGHPQTLPARPGGGDGGLRLLPGGPRGGKLRLPD